MLQFGTIQLEEAAVIDGCTQWQAFACVIVPVVRPGLAAMAALLLLAQRHIVKGLTVAAVKGWRLNSHMLPRRKKGKEWQLHFMI